MHPLIFSKTHIVFVFPVKNACGKVCILVHIPKLMVLVLIASNSTTVKSKDFLGVLSRPNASVCDWSQ